MSDKYKIIISSILLSAISVILYLSFRADTIENEYTANLTKIYASINNSYIKIEPEISKSKENASLREFFEKSIKSYPEIALIALADEGGTILLASKNDKYIKTAELFDSILNDFSEKKILIDRNKRFAVKYYEQGPEKKKEQIKFYIYTLYGTRSSLLAVFPYDPNFNLILKIAIEVLLVIALCVMLISAFHILTRKNKKQNDQGIVNAINKKNSNEINITKSVITDEPEVNLPINMASSASYDALNQHVFDLFKTIYKKFTPVSISLHLKNTNDAMNKAYELRGKSFLKIESSNYDPIEVSSSIAEELKNSSYIILDSGKKIMLPVINDRSIIGILGVVSDSQLSSSVINEIKESIQAVIKPLAEFISISSGMIDRESGLYSKTFFNMRLTELISAKKAEDKNFTLMIIKLFSRNDMPDNKNISTAFKLLSPAIMEILPAGSQLFGYGEYITVLSNSPDYEFSSKTETLLKTLARYRIKISRDKQLPVYPAFSLISSINMENPSLMLETALKKISED